MTANSSKNIELDFQDSLTPQNLSRMLWLLVASTSLSVILAIANILKIRQGDFTFWMILDIGGSLLFLLLLLLAKQGRLSKVLQRALAPAYFAFWLILMDGYYFNSLAHYGETATYALGTVTPAVLILLSPSMVLRLVLPNHLLFCYIVLHFQSSQGELPMEAKMIAVANGSLGVIIAILAAWYLYHARRGTFYKERLVNERTIEARRAESNLRAILANIPFQAWLKDTKGVFLAVNREFAKDHDSTEEALIGKSTAELYDAERAEEYMREDEEIFRHGEKRYFEQYVDDGERRRWFEVFKSPVLDDAGVCLGTAGVAREITERKELEQRLLAADAAKSEFLAIMSHEIRTPMNSVLGYARLLQDMPLAPLQKEYVNSINNSGYLLLSVINDILDFSKLDAGKISLQNEVVSLRDLAGRLLAMSEPLALEKKLSLGLNVAPEIPPLIEVDPRRLEQLLANLLSNAVKFTEYGSVELRIAPVGSPDPQKPWPLRLQVIDTGIGISPEQRQRLFQAFSQIDTAISRRFTGTGLGLVIVERLCHLMGGEIAVESEVGRGSVFTATIMVKSAIEDKAHSAVLLEAGEQIDFSPIRILGVEDNLTNRRLLAAILGRWGITPTLVEGGRQAIEETEKNRYDIILMDVQMPGMDGLEATRAIRRAEASSGHRHFIVALTALAQSEDNARCLEAGMDVCLTKPLNMDALYKILAAEAGRNKKARRA